MILSKQGQAASEYLIVMGIVMFLVITTFLVFFQYNQQNQTNIASAQADSLAKKLVDAAEEVYYLGKPSRNTVQVYMPSNVAVVNITSKELNIRIKTIGGISDVEQSSKVPLNGSISPTAGTKYIELTAADNYVCIVEQGGSC
ncbi:hypothetical protein HY772_08540 [Candidatus Woesearchaeota archaeon]|nr:hypothetical protein [Candidatus Woesearchaeota archaeon]